METDLRTYFGEATKARVVKAAVLETFDSQVSSFLQDVRHIAEGKKAQRKPPKV